MIKQLEKLSGEERNLLFKAPVLLSVLASCSYNGVNEQQKADALKLSHLKTFTADPLLIPFYVEVEKHFEEEFESTLKQSIPFDESIRSQLKDKINQVEQILSKLDNYYASKLHKSFEKYERHVTRAGHSIVEDFIFPMPIRGLTA
jgi:mRNA-degrading endonuclease RelE of RelBE toxin-antitoxin system